LTTKDPNDYGEACQKVFYVGARAYGPSTDIVTQLKERRGVKPDEIDSVLFSHAHWYLDAYIGSNMH
jgi:hypothetical protein